MSSKGEFSGAAFGGRLCCLALLFADLCDSSVLAEQLGAEQYAALLKRLRATVSAVVARHRGLVVRAQGDGFLAVFGHPDPGEHDTRNACDAALELQAEAARWPEVAWPGGRHHLALHCGVHTGPVLVLEGDIECGRLDLFGEPANTAARLATAAGRGETLVDKESLGPKISLFETTAERELSVRGRENPLLVVTLCGPACPRRRGGGPPLRSVLPLVGRAPALQLLLQACTASEATGARLMELRGEAGMGKTRVLDELAERLRHQGRVCLRGSCDNVGTSMVLAPFHQVLAELDPGGSASAGAAMQPGPLRDALAEALDQRAEPAPVVLIDDWQWADDASRQLLDELMQRCRQLRVVLACRPHGDEAVGAGERQPLVLRPFSREETDAAVAALAPGTNPFLVDQLHEYAGGVPLLVEEMCHMLRHRGEAGFRALRDSGLRQPAHGSGGWMVSLMAARLNALTDVQRRIVRATAVIGIRAQQSLVAELVAEGLSDDDLARLSEADLLLRSPDGSLQFRHGLTRDAVYQLTPREERLQLHRRVVRALQSSSPQAWGMADGEALDALAHHTAHAEDWPRATERCEVAAEQSMRLGALDRARALYLRAIQSAEMAGLHTSALVQRWCTMVHKLGMACMFDPLALPEVMPLIRLCVTRAAQLGDAETVARSLYWHGYLSYVFGRPLEAAVRLTREALDVARRQGAQRLVAQVEATLGQALGAACEYDEAMSLMNAALQAKREGVRGGGSVAVGSAFTLACKASVLGDRGEFAEARRALAEARDLVGQAVHPVANSVRNWEMVVLAWQGEWNEALRVVEECVRIAERTRALLPLAIARAVGGYALWRRDGDPAAVQQVAQAVRWMEERKVFFFTGIYYGWLVEMCVVEGRRQEARRWAARLLRRARTGERLGEGCGWRALGWQARQESDVGRARRCLARAESSARRRRSAREGALNALLEAEVLRAEGHGSEAADLQLRAQAMLQEMAAWAGRPAWALATEARARLTR